MPPETAFFTAIKNGDLIKVTQMLDSRPDLIFETDEDGTSALLTAIYYQEPKIVSLLIERGVSQTLFEASAAGSTTTVRSILDREPSKLNTFSPDGFQALGLAAFFGHAEIVKLLLDRGADIGTPSRNGLAVTPLNSAAAGEHLEIATLLLEHGADPNYAQSEGFTPLHAAAQNGQRAMIELLLKHGSKTDLKNAQGLTALDLAIQSGHTSLAKLLK